MSNSEARLAFDDSLLARFSSPTQALTGKVIVVSGNTTYIDRYFVDLWESCLEYAPDWQILLIVVGASQNEVSDTVNRYKDYKSVSIIFALLKPAQLDTKAISRLRSDAYLRMICVNQLDDKFFLRQIIKLLLRISVPKRYLLFRQLLQTRVLKTSYACVRFVLPASVLANCEKIIIADIDSVLTESFKSVIEEQRYVGAVRSRNSWSKYLAGLVVLPSHSLIADFFSTFSEYMNDEMNNQVLTWGVDQLVLDKVMEKVASEDLVKGMSFSRSSYNGEAIISWKGKLKHGRS